MFFISLIHHLTPTCEDCTHADAVRVAQVVAHEARFDSPPDMLAIYEVLFRTRQIIRAVSKGKGTMVFAADQYSGVATGSKPPRDDLDAWAQRLPTSHEPSFFVLVRQVETLFLSPQVSPCLLPPRHWGGAMDRPRARAMRFVAIPCAGTKNDFYALPRR